MNDDAGSTDSVDTNPTMGYNSVEEREEALRTLSKDKITSIAYLAVAVVVAYGLSISFMLFERAM